MIGRRGFLALGAGLIAAPAFAGAPLSRGVRLLMVVSRGCPFCAAWRREVGPGYASSTLGRIAPVAEVDLDGPWPDGLVIGARPDRTPTFILLRDGQEIDRLIGYDGPDSFRLALRGLLRSAGLLRG
ncbi:thioredoxin family protein [Paracoccus aminophilus]|uniref:Thioredoxin n=1 Tax=Paracoccus aminophilus JCM 7686 TaxID=1367847 RepID=S5Y1X7_PARAH|nr:thioredoxin family protein [Paracoccus aminophilus]AGT09735.1 thioredoxin [Paracoccus aminophilus JCM 7686]